MRRISAVFISTIMVLLCLLSAASLENSKVTVIVNGNTIHFDAEPYIVNGCVLVPVRPIMDALGAKVIWDSKTKTVTIKKGNIILELKINSCLAKENNEEIALGTPAKILNGRTFVPLRFINEHVHADVQWDNKTRTVTILQKDSQSVRENSILVPDITFEDKEISLLDDRLFIKMPKSPYFKGDETIVHLPPDATNVELMNVDDRVICFSSFEMFCYSTGDLKQRPSIISQ